MRMFKLVVCSVAMVGFAGVSGCALEEEGIGPADTLEAEEMSTDSYVDATSRDDDTATVSTDSAELDIVALPICDWVALFAGGSVPMFRPTNTVDCRLFEGTSGAGVRQLQHSMNRCYGERLVEDGDFGPATRSALVRTQGKSGVRADGEYGTATRKAMLHDRIGGGCIRVP